MRNLTAGEILLQVEHAKRLLDDFPKMEDRVDKKTDIADIADIADLDMEEKRQNEHEGKQRDEGKRAITNIVFMVLAQCPLIMVMVTTSSHLLIRNRVKASPFSTTRMSDRLSRSCHILEVTALDNQK
jgi:hypothetical protein